MNVALLIIFAFLALSIYLGIRARRGKDMNLEEWSVGGRGFGTIFVFLLLAGEIYTTFTFLGASGWAYGRGGPAFYILSYGALAYVMSYWLLPAVWRYAKENRLHSQSDFFVSKYRSTGLGVVVSLVTVLAMVPYLAVQFQGLGIIVSEASYGSISSTVAVVIGVVAVTVYVIVSGIHGSAWTSTVKDIMVLAIIVFLGLYLPFAFYMWPHTFGSAFSARSARVIRRNATYLPIYQLVMLFAFFVGFASILQIPGLEGPEADLSLLRISLETFDPWIVGLIGAAGLLAALVPGSMLLMVSATVLSKNVYKAFRPEVTEEQVVRLAKILVPLVALAGMVFALTSGLDLVLLLLLGYAFVTQLFPALAFSFLPNNFVTKWGAGAGVLTGVAIVAYLEVFQIKLRAVFPALGSLGDTNVGIVAMLANIVVLVVVSLATRPSTVAKEQRA